MRNKCCKFLNKFDKLSKYTNLLYNLLWKDKNIVLKSLYIAVPFLIIAVFAIMIVTSGVWEISREGLKIYSFSDDLSNTYVVTGVFIFVYFARGFFTEYLEGKIKKLRSNFNIDICCKCNKIDSLVKVSITIISFVLIFAAVLFMVAATNKGELNWYYYFGNFNLIFYYFLIAYCWILSANLFMLILYYNYCLIKYTKHALAKVDFFNKDKCCGFKSVFKCLAASLGFGIYFALYIGVIGYSDYRAHKYFCLDFFFYEGWEYILIIFIILAALYFTAILYAYFRFKLKVNEAIENKMKNYSLGTKERTFLEKINISLFNPSNIFAFVSSFIIPSISAVVTLNVDVINTLIHT